MAKRPRTRSRKQTTQAPVPNPTPIPITAGVSIDASDVGYLDKQATSLKSILNTTININKAKSEAATFTKQIAQLEGKQLENAQRTGKLLNEIANYEKNIATAKKLGADPKQIRNMQAFYLSQRKELNNLQKTEGGIYKTREFQAKKQATNLETEKKLIQDVNKERGIGNRLLDVFRTKEQTQRRIDIARAKVNGGINTPGEEGSGKKKSLTDTLKETKSGKVAIAGAVAGYETLKAVAKSTGEVTKTALAVPFASAANLLTGQDYGMGGGSVNASGATSMLGGLEKIASSIPFIGGLLGGLVGAFKGMLDAVLGVEEANFRVARSMNISVGAAEKMRKQFDGVANASDNIVVNSTRMLQSQIELGNQLGVNKQLSNDILVNDTKLRDILGLEAGSRQAIADASIVTGRSATKLTQGVIGTVGAFNKMVGTSFEFNAIIKEASQQSGVMGLTFAKYPEKITKAILATKTLGFELKQLDSTADSFLDFEGSISKEMEAQVLTGKDLNLTRAREAALNNDNATLAQEITKNVGDANSYLKLNRIQQEAIANSVGMTRDSLADVLKKQELYSKLGATDVKTFNEKITLLEKQGKTQQQISDLIGKDNYNTYTQVSTAEKLSEIMQKIQKVFVDFVKNSGLFDFLTDPKKIDNFIKGLADKLASTISFIGEVIATMLEGVSHLPFTDTDKWQGLASKVRSGAGSLAGGISATGNSLGGAISNSVSGTKEAGAQKEAAQQQAMKQTSAGQPLSSNVPDYLHANLYMDGHQITTAIVPLLPQNRQATSGAGGG